MSKKPPLRSAKNKTLDASVFDKYKSFVPKTEIDSPRYDNLVKSAVQVQQVKEYLVKKPGTNRLKQGSAEAIRNIINK
jgi:hypothetical protein